ncbi:MAG: acetyl/propionyl/methylcrotonyl-CoA carboxylase subunit alpha [Candidatus Promineifilaceae bacterium]
MSFYKILIANRGEIACRIIRTAQGLGYATVAVFSDADADAPHVQMADQAVRIGPAEVGESYLNAERMLDAARRSAADAIHPGYGFLSENANFAKQVAEAGLTWIGPPPAAIEIMGNKSAAKQAVADSNVPLVPGYAGADQTDAIFVAEADKIGYPVMVKASAGGGGRGMRLVHSADALPNALASARSEALKAFGSDELLLEKAIVNPRHIEFQVFGDQHGNIIHLGERDCSIQRRHQKVVEEAPSPALSAELRAKMGAAAVAAAQAVGYYSAGTVEFLLNEAGDFYFIEMNTRLQVEHPVTELITGLDLVEWMLLVADGQALPLTQEMVSLSGHAIEVRLYAESAENNFLPSTGTVWHYQTPAGDGVRVDDGLRSGMAITPFYDAMVAKLITYGPTRAVAQRRLRRALQQTVVLGVDTNRRFLLDTVTHPIFTAGEATTAFIEQTWRPKPAPPSTMLELLAAVILYQTSAQSGSQASFGNWGRQAATYCFDVEKRARLIYVESGSQGLCVTLGEQTIDIRVLSCADNRLVYEVDSLRDVATFAFGADGELWLQAGLETASFEDVLLAVVDSADVMGSGRIVAPMPGAVLRIDVAIGDRVQKGQSLLVLEAMKMEHTISAPFDGLIEQVLIQQGQQMKPREVMIVVSDR